MTNTELNKKWGEYQNIWLCFKGQDFGSRLTGLHPDHFSWQITRGTLPGSGWEERAGRAFTSYKPGTGVRSISGLWVPDPHSTMAFGWLYMSWKGETAPVQVRTGLGGVLGIGRSPGASGPHSSMHLIGLLSALLPTGSYRSMEGLRSWVQTGPLVKANPQASSLCFWKKNMLTGPGLFLTPHHVHLDHETGFLNRLHVRPSWVLTRCLSFSCLFAGKANLWLDECFLIVHLFPFGVLLWKFRV